MSADSVPATNSARLAATDASRRHRAWNQILRRNWPATLALLWLLGLGLVAVVPSVFAPRDPLATNPREAFAEPSARFLLGSDELGRDLLSRIVYGTRVSLGTALAVVAGAAVIGVPLGLIAGYTGGWVESLLMRVIDVLLAFPAILLAMGLVAVLGQGTANAAIAVAVVSVPGFARLTRASTLAQKQLDYVAAARAIGASHGRIMIRTVLPNCLGPLVVQAALAAATAILLEAALSFLGLGVKPPTPSWGQMLSTGKDFLYRAPWYGLYPGVALTLVVLALNRLGDVAQQVVDRGWRSL
jgi:ABC-type dipeptide/oligopeptide/nickel transport system permease subunit